MEIDATRFKYPRTLHLPWSGCIASDDKVADNILALDGVNVIVTIKMDGENTTMYNDYIHARSLDSKNHISRDWVKNFHSRIKGDIPKGWRVCGENVYATHSIEYTDLETYFYGFSIWDDRNICLPWLVTLEWFDLLGITPVPTMYSGIFDRDKIQLIFDNNFSNHEGYIIRSHSGFYYNDFSNHVFKWVRKDHIQSNIHWTKAWVKNTLREESTEV